MVLYPTTNCLVLINPKSNEYPVHPIMPKNVDWASMVNYMLYHNQITRNSSLSKAVVQLHVEQSTSVNSRVNFGTKFSWKVPAKNFFVQEERVVSTILLIEKVMMTLSNSYNLRSRAGGMTFPKSKGLPPSKNYLTMNPIFTIQ
ncbi:hypothetical protein [Candidatus Nitrosocosmicus sp. R]